MAELETRADFLRFQWSEIREAKLREGEEEELEEEARRLENVEELAMGAQGLYEGLYGGEDSVSDRTSSLRGLLDQLSKLDPALEALILRALAKQPTERFADAERMREAMDAVLNNLGVPVAADTLLGSVSGAAVRSAAQSDSGRTAAGEPVAGGERDTANGWARPESGSQSAAEASPPTAATAPRSSPTDQAA